MSLKCIHLCIKMCFYSIFLEISTLQSDQRYYISASAVFGYSARSLCVFLSSHQKFRTIRPEIEVVQLFFCNQLENLLLSTSLNEPAVNNFWVYRWKKKTPTAPLCTVGACGTRHPYLCVAVEVAGHLLYTLKTILLVC